MLANKVYVVWYDNGEAWEDNYQNIEAIFATREEAEAYLDAEYKRYESSFFDYKLKKFVPCHKWEIRENGKPLTCKKGRTGCQGCPKYEEWFNNPGAKEDPCDEYFHMPDYPMVVKDTQSWKIREYKLGKPNWKD